MHRLAGTAARARTPLPQATVAEAAFGSPLPVQHPCAEAGRAGAASTRVAGPQRAPPPHSRQSRDARPGFPAATRDDLGLVATITLQKGDTWRFQSLPKQVGPASSATSRRPISRAPPASRPAPRAHGWPRHPVARPGEGAERLIELAAMVERLAAVSIRPDYIPIWLRKPAPASFPDDDKPAGRDRRRRLPARRRADLGARGPGRRLSRRCPRRTRPRSRLRGSWWRHAPLGADPWHRPAVPGGQQPLAARTSGRRPVPRRLARHRVGGVVPPTSPRAPSRRCRPFPRELARARVDLEGVADLRPADALAASELYRLRAPESAPTGRGSSAPAKRCTAGRRSSPRRRRGRAVSVLCAFRPGTNRPAGIEPIAPPERVDQPPAPSRGMTT